MDRALAVLGPLERRIMRAVWSRAVPELFVVRDVREGLPRLAYTTVMTTLNRLADKGLLVARRVPHQRAHEYRVAVTPDAFLAAASQQHVERLVQRYGDAALAAFTARLEALTPARRERLRSMRSR